MNRPGTAQPACFKTSAATAESTPPESPTMTRSPAAGGGKQVLIGAILPKCSDRQRFDAQGSLQIQVRNGCKLAANAGEVVLNTAHDERAAQARLALLQLSMREPMGGHD